MPDNLLSKIPGESPGAAGYSLRPVESSTETTQCVTVPLPDSRRVEVTFVGMQSKKGKSTRWLWKKTLTFGDLPRVNLTEEEQIEVRAFHRYGARESRKAICGVWSEGHGTHRTNT